MSTSESQEPTGTTVPPGGSAPGEQRGGAAPARPSDNAQPHAGFPARSIDAVASAAAGTLRWGAPFVRAFGIRFGNWLAAIGWWKFIFLSILLLIFSNLASSILFSAGNGHDIHHAQGKVTVDVHIVPLPDGGLWISSPAESAAQAGKRTARPPAAKDASDGVLPQLDGDGSEQSPAVRIDKQGVRVLADDGGRKVSVVIDHSGVHVQELAPAKDGAGKDGASKQGLDQKSAPNPPLVPAPPVPAPPGRPGAAAVRIGPDDAADPEKVAGAVEAARDQIESMLQDQVDDKLKALAQSEDVERGDWVGLLTTMSIVALIALKVVLGSKTRAELQARKASATAAEEGLKRQLAEAQLKTMQAQVEPHFLFNTLASVDYLIETDPARASRMQKNLIQYLRTSLPQMREGVSSLGREVLQCRSYLEILKVRMDERLQFSINVPQVLLSASFPPMMLLTLVENAIKHGLEPKP